MANQYQNMTSGLPILKNFYQGPIQDQLNEDVNIYRGCEKGKHAWSGLQVIRPLKIRRNQGIGATSEGGNLPAVGRQGTAQAIILAKFNYLRFGITGPMIAASQKDVGSFVRGAAYELEEGYNDLRSDMNRQMSWDGTGKLATVSSAAVGSTALVIFGRESTEPALKFIDVGMVIDIVTTAGVVKASGVTVSAIASGTAGGASSTLTLSAAVTCAANDILIRANSLNLEVQGLLTALDNGTTTIFNIDRSSALSFQGNVIDRGGGQMTLDSLQQTEDEAERRGGKIISAIYSDHASRRMYQKLLTADKRFVNTVKGDGGFSDSSKNYLEFNGKPWVADKDCPTRVFFLPEKNIEKYVLKEMEFADESGSMYIPDSNTDQLEVRLRLFANLFNSKPAGTGCYTNYTSP
jgi:hypothetical protein